MSTCSAENRADVRAAAAAGAGRGSGSSQKKAGSTAAKAQRESRFVPTLVYHMEQFEVLLLKYAKACKVRAPLCLCACSSPVCTRRRAPPPHKGRCGRIAVSVDFARFLTDTPQIVCK